MKIVTTYADDATFMNMYTGDISTYDEIIARMIEEAADEDRALTRKEAEADFQSLVSSVFAEVEEDEEGRYYDVEYSSAIRKKDDDEDEEEEVSHERES
jgi:hypothetical protein